MDQKGMPKPSATAAATALAVSTLSGSGVKGNANADAGAAAQFDAPDLVVLWRATSTAPAVALVHSNKQLRSVCLRTGATRTAATFGRFLSSLYVCPRDNSLWASTNSQVFHLTASAARAIVAAEPSVERCVGPVPRG